MRLETDFSFSFVAYGNTKMPPGHEHRATWVTSNAFSFSFPSQTRFRPWRRTPRNL